MFRCSMTPTSYDCSTEKLIRSLSKQCDNQKFCFVEPTNDWLVTDDLSGSGMYQMEGSSSGFEDHEDWISPKCFKIAYVCDFEGM